MTDLSRPMPTLLTRAALVLAPLLALISELVVPRDETTTAADELAFVATHSGAFLVADLLAFAAAALFVVGLLGLAAAAWERGRWAVRIGAVAALVGALALVAHPMLLLAIRDLAVADPVGMASADDVISEGVAAMLVLALRLLAFDLGLVVLTIGLWRARLLPVWLAPAGILALFADFSPTSYNAVLMNLVLLAAFAVLAIKAQRVMSARTVPAAA